MAKFRYALGGEGRSPRKVGVRVRNTRGATPPLGSENRE